MKIIFLNINGVLNSKHCNIKSHKANAFINPRFVRNLKKIIDKTGAKVVLSTSLRKNAKANKSCNLKKIFRQYNIDIYDYTPYTGMDKGIDIQEWLNHHLDVTNIAILDANSDMCHLMEYLVKTNNCYFSKIPFLWYFNEGLCGKKIKQTICVLNKPFVNKMLRQITHNMRKPF